MGELNLDMPQRSWRVQQPMVGSLPPGGGGGGGGADEVGVEMGAVAVGVVFLVVVVGRA